MNRLKDEQHTRWIERLFRFKCLSSADPQQLSEPPPNTRSSDSAHSFLSFWWLTTDGQRKQTVLSLNIFFYLCKSRAVSVYIQRLYIQHSHQHGCSGHAGPHTPSNYSWLLKKKKKEIKGRETWREIHTRINKRFQKAPGSSWKEKNKIKRACI